jgi:hypothetical protein
VISIPSAKFIARMGTEEHDGAYEVNATTEGGIDHEFTMTVEEER